MKWLALALLLLALPALAQGAKPGEGVLTHNRQFLFGFYDDSHESKTLWNVLEALKPDQGMDDMLRARASRIQGNMERPMMRIDGPKGTVMWRNWFETVGFGFASGDAFLDASGRRWHIQKMFLDEMILAGLAVHRWRCEPRNKPIIETQLQIEIEDMDALCARTNAQAKEVFDRINSRGIRTGAN